MSEAQKQRQHELLWMLWFDEKIYLGMCIVKCTVVVLHRPTLKLEKEKSII